MAKLTDADAAAMERAVAGGGVVVFPSETVYGMACDAQNPAAAARLYKLKGRPPAKPAAVMFFQFERAMGLFEAAGPLTTAAASELLPGAMTLVIDNPERRFESACGPDPLSVGVRVPALPPALAALVVVSTPLLQTSANLAGGPDARRVEDVPDQVRAGADLVLDGGELPGTPSTVVDLRGYDDARQWRVLREGAVSAAEIELVLNR